MSQEREQTLARRRAELIVAVRSGQLTATEAARQMGVSRKTYYEWEAKALAALVKALEPQTGGRPAQTTDPQQEQLRRQNEQLTEQVQMLEQSLQIRRILEAPDKKK